MYRCTGFDRHKIIGYTANDSIRFRVMIAQALGCETADVEGMVIGEHGESQVPLFSSIRIKGKPVKIEDSTRQKISSRISETLQRYEELKTGRTAGVTSAAGMKDVVRAIINNTHDVIPARQSCTGNTDSII
jgi:malate/lactate dehydrogenase